MNFILEILKIIIWPLVLGLILIKFITLFKKEISILIKKIDVLTFKGGKIQFKKNLKDKQKKTPREIELLKKENQSLQDEKEKAIVAQTQSFLFYHYEKTYRLIFGSQLQIVLIADSQMKITYDTAKQIYNSTSWINTYPYNQYINFLINSGLITELNSVDNSYHIQPIGKEFLKYLTVNNIAIAKLPY